MTMDAAYAAFMEEDYGSITGRCALHRSPAFFNGEYPLFAVEICVMFAEQRPRCSMSLLPVGKWADFVVFDLDVMDERLPAATMLEAEVQRTVLGGRTVYTIGDIEA